MEKTEIIANVSVIDKFGDQIRSVDRSVELIPIERALSESVYHPQILIRSEIPNDLLVQILDKFPSIKWVHSYSAGVEGLIPILQNRNLVLTNSAGLHGEPIAEWVIAMTLAHAKRFHLLFRHFQAHEWQAEECDELGGKTMVIVGAGGIGASIARRAKCLGMKIVGVRSSGRSSEYFDEMLTPDSLHTALGKGDYVVIATPLTPQTEGLIGEPELKAMKNSAVLLNIARGKIVQTEALMRALSEGWIAAAYLDVTDPEPLPPDHPLWSTPNVFITAHTSGYSPYSAERLAKFFCENLRRWLQGEPLLNQVDLARGY